MGYRDRQPNSVIGYEPIAQINQRLAELALLGEQICHMRQGTNKLDTPDRCFELDRHLDDQQEKTQNLGSYIETNGLSSCIPAGVEIDLGKIRLHPALAHRTIEFVRSFE